MRWQLIAREAWVRRTYGSLAIQTISALPGQECRSFFSFDERGGMVKAHEWRRREYGTA